MPTRPLLPLPGWLHPRTRQDALAARERGWWVTDVREEVGGLVQVSYALRDGSTRMVAFASSAYGTDAVADVGAALRVVRG